MLPDPRRFEARSGPGRRFVPLDDLAAQSLAAETSQVAGALDAQLGAALGNVLDAGDGAALAALVEGAPSLPVQRKHWRTLAARLAGDGSPPSVGLVPFVIPVVIVAASNDGNAELPAVLDAPGGLARLLVEHGALGGCTTFSLSPQLVGASALALDQLPAWTQATVAADTPLDLTPAPMTIERQQGAYLRFLAGIAVSSPARVDGDATFDRWAAALSRAITTGLARPGVTVLALPRPPAPLLQGLMRGRAAHREVAAQLFASESLRTLRASVGEPVAILSAHRCADAPGGGELRLSLSSPFSPRDAYGFRCPLQPAEGVADAAAMLAELLDDCRVQDVRTLPGVHPDQDPVTGGALFFKPGTLPTEAPLH